MQKVCPDNGSNCRQAHRIRTLLLFSSRSPTTTEFDSPALAVEMGRERSSPTKQTPKLVTQAPLPGKRFPGVCLHAGPKALQIAGGRQTAFGSEGDRPDVCHSPSGAVPPEHAHGVGRQEKVQGFGSEPPIITGVGMNVKVEGRGDNEHPVVPQDALNLIEPKPEPLHMLESAHG